MKKNLILLGMMGVGKTTYGRIVAKKLDLNFWDTDNLIEKDNLMKIKEIFKKKGEAFFRKEEEKIVLKCLKEKKSIIALGGGAFINNKIRNIILSDSISMWLNVDIKTLSIRLNKNLKRPLLKKKDNFETLNKIYAERKNIYKLANHKIDCDNLGVNRVVENILKIYEKY